jgi:endonuclease YncB( thermonuclease family)
MGFFSKRGSMVFRALVLSLALLIIAGIVIPLSTISTEASSVKHTNYKKKFKKFKKYSKKWWRAHHNRLRKRKASEARKRVMRLRRIRLADTNKSSAQTIKQNASEIVSINPPIQIDNLFSLLEGKIKNVLDGDTVNLETKDGKVHLIRMLGVDAPERRQDFGSQSQKKLRNLILGKAVTVIIRKKDSSNRFVGTVYFGGQDINLKQIETGMARYFQQNGYEPKEGDRKLYQQAEQAAQIKRYGLWQKQNLDVALKTVKIRM